MPFSKRIDEIERAIDVTMAEITRLRAESADCKISAPIAKPRIDKLLTALGKLEGRKASACDPTDQLQFELRRVRRRALHSTRKARGPAPRHFMHIFRNDVRERFERKNRMKIAAINP